MKTAEETLSHVASMIWRIYERPMMHACTKRQLDGVLHTYHHFWAYLTGREQELQDAFYEALDGHNTDHHYIGEKDDPPATDYGAVIALWQCVDEKLGIARPTSSAE